MRMPVIRVGFLSGILSIVMTCILTTPAAAQKEITFDVFAFSQEDDVGQPFKSEGMGYQGGRATVVLPLTPSATLRLSTTLSHIQNDVAAELPATVLNSRITSASADIIALDASATLTIRSPGSAWIVTPGAYYHHQDAFVAVGPDITVAREVNGGDTILHGTWGLRLGYPKLSFWNQVRLGRDQLTSINMTVGVTQTLSPSWVVDLGAQFTYQRGFLTDPYNYVVIYDQGNPMELTSESLPRHRNRLQLNTRLRYSPVLGIGFGLDNSFYVDDWGIRHLSAEPNAAFPLLGGMSSRIWYRLSLQHETDYFYETPAFEHTYQTQDTDLGSFTMHTGGTTLRIPLGKGSGTQWEPRITVFGFYRDDKIYAIGGNLGITVRW